MSDFDRGLSAGLFLASVFLFLVLLFGPWTREWDCEYTHDVYDCDSQWVPVLKPEGEL